jgi:hypothetical protein
MRVQTLAVLVMAVVLGLAGRAGADNKFHGVPAAKADKGKLQIKIVRYDGATNGELTVQVKNTSKAAAKFSARGLYFVPDGDPDQAPQRLGAVGPFQIATDGDVSEADQEKLRKESLTLAPGQTVELTLDVFCIDSHRSSPSSETAFTVGKSRMPATLAGNIDRKAKHAAAESGGFAAPAAKSAVQSEVWAARDANWIQLDGEGDQEAGK